MTLRAVETDQTCESAPMSANGISVIRLAPPRKAALILDLPNVSGSFANAGYVRVDPRWYLNMVARQSKLVTALVVADMEAFDPIGKSSYLESSRIWARYGYRTVHASSKIQSLSESGNPYDEEDFLPSLSLKELQATRKTTRKDMSDGYLQMEMELICHIPEITDIYLGTHDVDFALNVQGASWIKNKRVTLLTIGDRFVSNKLKSAADESINILAYSAYYSAISLQALGWWRMFETEEIRLQRLMNWFGVNGEQTARYPYIIMQLRDMQLLIRHMTDHLLLVPQSNIRFSRSRLRNSMHDFWSWEKKIARLPVANDTTETQASQGVPETLPKEMISPYSLQAHDSGLPPMQLAACDWSLNEIINIFVSNKVLITTMDPATKAKYYHVNTDHPAVRMLQRVELP